MGIIRVTIWLIGFMNLLTKCPCPSKKLVILVGSWAVIGAALNP